MGLLPLPPGSVCTGRTVRWAGRARAHLLTRCVAYPQYRSVTCLPILPRPAVCQAAAPGVQLPGGRAAERGGQVLHAGGHAHARLPPARGACNMGVFDACLLLWGGPRRCLSCCFASCTVACCSLPAARQACRHGAWPPVQGSICDHAHKARPAAHHLSQGLFEEIPASDFRADVSSTELRAAGTWV